MERREKKTFDFWLHFMLNKNKMAYDGIVRKENHFYFSFVWINNQHLVDMFPREENKMYVKYFRRNRFFCSVRFCLWLVILSYTLFISPFTYWTSTESLLILISTKNTDLEWIYIKFLYIKMFFDRPQIGYGHSFETEMRWFLCHWQQAKLCDVLKCRNIPKIEINSTVQTHNF